MSDVCDKKNKNSEALSDIRTFRENSEKKLLALLGFASRARRIVCGADLCRDSIRRGQAILTVISSDASFNTKKRIVDACRYYGTTACVAPIGSDRISDAIGKTGSTAVIGICDVNFASGISALFAE